MLTLNVIICECSGIFHEKSKIVFRPDSNASEYFGYTVLLASNKYVFFTFCLSNVFVIYYAVS